MNNSEVNNRHIPKWKMIVKKIKPYLTYDDILKFDQNSFYDLLDRLRHINKLDESEYTYAKTNTNMILIRMGLLHLIPEMNNDLIELCLKQLAAKLANIYYHEGKVHSWEEAGELIGELIKEGIHSDFKIALNIHEEFDDLITILNNYSDINPNNAEEIYSSLCLLRDSLVEIGLTGSLIYEVEKYCQKLDSISEKDVELKGDLLDSVREWKEKI